MINDDALTPKQSFNNIIWKIVPKFTNSGANIVELATFVATCIFNEGTKSLLHIMNELGMEIGRNCHQYTVTEDERRISQADVRAMESTKEARLARRQSQIVKETTEDTFYGPGIDEAWYI